MSSVKVVSCKLGIHDLKITRPNCNFKRICLRLSNSIINHYLKVSKYKTKCPLFSPSNFTCDGFSLMTVRFKSPIYHFLKRLFKIWPCEVWQILCQFMAKIHAKAFERLLTRHETIFLRLAHSGSFTKRQTNISLPFTVFLSLYP